MAMADDDLGGHGSLPPTEVDAVDATVRGQAPRMDGVPAETKRTHRWQNIMSAASVVCLLAGSVVGGRMAYQWLTRTPRFGARQIEVIGAHHTRREEVLAAARLQIGTNVLGFDTLRAEERIEQLPWVERAHVTRRLPGYVRIDIEERTAAAIVSAGGLYLCSIDGTLFKRLQPGDPVDLPLVTGIAREEFERDPEGARERVRDALALLVDLASSSLAGRVRVEEIHRDVTGDLSLVLDGGVYVWLGRGPYRAKLARLSAILSELQRQHIPAAEIHLESERHPERATVRVRIAPAPDGSPDVSSTGDRTVASTVVRVSSHRGELASWGVSGPRNRTVRAVRAR